jgi:hypothetical protein
MKAHLTKTVFCFFSLALLPAASPVDGQTSAENRFKNERRNFIESLLLKGSHQHDGARELLYIGTIKSVPALLKVLGDNQPFVEKPLTGFLPPESSEHQYYCSQDQIKICRKSRDSNFIFV